MTPEQEMYVTIWLISNGLPPNISDISPEIIAMAIAAYKQSVE